MQRTRRHGSNCRREIAPERGIRSLKRMDDNALHPCGEENQRRHERDVRGKAPRRCVGFERCSFVLDIAIDICQQVRGEKRQHIAPVIIPRADDAGAEYAGEEARQRGFPVLQRVIKHVDKNYLDHAHKAADKGEFYELPQRLAALDAALFFVIAHMLSHIDSGAETPSRARALRSVICSAMTSPTR